MDVPRGLPQAPWVLYYDGASRKPAGHAGLGAVLKNSRGQMVQEIKRYVGIGLTSGLAKYKALIAGLKKAKSLQVKHLLAKGNSRLLINQVVGHWSVRDGHLQQYLQKVLLLAQDFDSLFLEYIPKDYNLHADRIANEAIDKELQIAEVVSDYFDRPGWASKEQTSAPAFPHLKLKPVSPLPQNPNKDFSGKVSSFKGKKVRSIGTKDKVVSPNENPESELTRTMKSLQMRNSNYWEDEIDRLSISDVSSSEDSPVEERPNVPPAEARSDTDEDGESGEENVYLPHRPNIATSASNAESTLLSEADYDRLVTAVIQRLKKTKCLSKDS